MKKKHNQEELINQNIKIEELETSNRILMEKLKLLKIQLESQAQLQVSAFHLHRSTPLTHRSHQNLSHRNYNANGFHGKEEPTKISVNKQYESLFQQLHMLQKELETVKKQNRDRISELEEQLSKAQDTSPDKLKTELNDNVELIKLKRSTKKQTALIQSLQSQLEMANAEIKQLQANLSFSNNKIETLQTELSQEKLEIAKLSSTNETLKDTNKFLEEQLNDLQVEKNTLKEHNENLLKLSLQKESNVGVSDSRANYMKQIKELEDNLKKEVIAKSEALAKLADAEILNVKLQNELSKSSASYTEMKINNSTLKNQIEALREKLNNTQSRSIQKYNTISTEDKAVMVAINDAADVAYSKNTTENFSAISVDGMDSNDSNLKMQLYKISTELNQCKELLRVQCTLNNKHKSEMGELQKIFQKNEKTLIDCSRSLRNILRKHEDRLAELMKSGETEMNLQSTIDEMHNLTKFKRCNYQDYINVLDKLLHNYNVLVGDLKSKLSSTWSRSTVNIGINTIVEYACKVVQTESNEIGVNVLENVPNKDLVNKAPANKMATFELQFGKTVFNYFSEHLTRSTDNNPKIFLTWTFMDDNEHQAYTPTISVNDGQFNCSCQYDGPWSEALYEYLNERGISVEVHLVQGDISVRLAEGKINTADCIRMPNRYHEFSADFQNDNIKGSVLGKYVLKCEDDLFK